MISFVKRLLGLPGCEVRMTEKMGRGVFATRDFKKGELVLRDPVVVMPHTEHGELAKTILNFYGFSWPAHRGGDSTAFAMGIGSLMNHSNDLSVTYTQEPETNTIRFEAVRDIKKGEQLFINYGYDPDCWQHREYWKRRAEAEAAKKADQERHIAEQGELEEKMKAPRVLAAEEARALEDSDELREEIDATDHTGERNREAFGRPDRFTSEDNL